MLLSLLVLWLGRLSPVEKKFVEILTKKLKTNSKQLIEKRRNKFTIWQSFLFVVVSVMFFFMCFVVVLICFVQHLPVKISNLW